MTWPCFASRSDKPLILVNGELRAELVELSLQSGYPTAVTLVTIEVCHLVGILLDVEEFGIVSFLTSIEMDKLVAFVGDSIVFQDIVL